MAVSQPAEAFLDNVKQLYNNPQYSDLTVTCDDRKWLVHKCIVCSRSEWFAHALKPHTKEAQSGVIDLPKADPAVVEAVLRFLYTFDYSENAGNGQNISSPIVFDVRVHVQADYLCIKDLKKIAAAKFATRAETEWNTAEFAQAVALVYTSAADQDRELRDCIVKESSKNAPELFHGEKGAAFRELVGTLPALGSEISGKLVKGADIVGMTKYTCSSCSYDSATETEISGRSYAYCSNCGSQTYV